MLVSHTGFPVMGNAKLQINFLQRTAYKQPRLAELPNGRRESLGCIERTHRRSHSQFASSHFPLEAFGFVADVEAQGPSAGIASRPFVRAAQSMCRVELFAFHLHLFQGPHAALQPVSATFPESIFAVVRPFPQISYSSISNKQLDNPITPLSRFSPCLSVCTHMICCWI